MLNLMVQAFGWVTLMNRIGSENLRVTGYVTRLNDYYHLRSFILSASALNHRVVQSHGINLNIPLV